jgi:serine/threonine protein kinase
VKISDFGISKRAEEEVTAFHTLVGTRGYLAPEILGFFSPEDTNAHQYGQGNNMYTVSVDLWALGAIAFRLLTNQDIFVNPPDVGRYVILKQPFPTSPLLEKRISDTCINFIENIMARSPSDRLSAHQALTHAWLSELHDPVQQLDGMSTMYVNMALQSSVETDILTELGLFRVPTGPRGICNQIILIQQQAHSGQHGLNRKWTTIGLSNVIGDTEYVLFVDLLVVLLLWTGGYS